MDWVDRIGEEDPEHKTDVLVDELRDWEEESGFTRRIDARREFAGMGACLHENVQR